MFTREREREKEGNEQAIALYFRVSNQMAKVGGEQEEVAVVPEHPLADGNQSVLNLSSFVYPANFILYPKVSQFSLCAFKY